jgi:Zn-dependent protease
MKPALFVGRYFGIDVYIHWTLLLMVGVLAALQLAAGVTWPVVAHGMGLLAAVFLCVLLHEYGHALAARMYGISTHDITLLPIGGIARLERIPEHPRHELWVALAGPAVNLAIALALWPAASAARLFEPPDLAELTLSGFLAELFTINAALVVFNLIPAFPMDGGRVLRALLAMVLPYTRATSIAAGVGQVLAVLMGIVGLFTNWMLSLVALFVYFAARGETRQVWVRAMFRGSLVRDAMATGFRQFETTTTLAEAARWLLAEHQRDFPVVERGQIIGALHRHDLIAALTNSTLSSSISPHVDRQLQSVSPDVSLERAYAVMQESGYSLVPVVSHGEVVGILTTENVEEWLMIRSALDQRQQGKPSAGSNGAPAKMAIG